jgi:hypothetical protein
MTMTRYNKAYFAYEWLHPCGRRARRRDSGDPLETRPTVREWRQGHVRTVAEARTVCWGVTSGSVVRRVSGAFHGVMTVTPGGTRGHVDPLAKVRGLSRAVAGRLAGTVVRLCAVFSYHDSPRRSAPYASPWLLFSPTPPVACQSPSLTVPRYINF